MSQSEKWTNQRLALLRSHFQEWKTTVRQETQAREALVAKLQVKKNYIGQRANALEWAHYITQYAERLTNLAVLYQQQRQAMRSRQEQEIADLEDRINTERGLNK